MVLMTSAVRASRSYGSSMRARMRQQPGHGQRVRRLHQQGPRPAERQGALAVDAPQHRVVVEVAHLAEKYGP